MYVVYALYSEQFNKIYIGYTSNLEQRLISHNEKATKGYTVKYRPWKIVYWEACTSKKEALIREKQLKSAKGREFVKNMVAEQN